MIKQTILREKKLFLYLKFEKWKIFKQEKGEKKNWKMNKITKKKYK